MTAQEKALPTAHGYSELIFMFWESVEYGEWESEVQKVVNPVILRSLDDRKYIQNQVLAENISKI